MEISRFDRGGKRDYQRAAVYKFDQLGNWDREHRKPQLSESDCLDLVSTAHRMFDLQWRGKLVFPKKGSFARGHHSSISLPPWSKSTLIVLHETAHAIMEQMRSRVWPYPPVLPPHGAMFARVMIELWAVAGVAPLDEIIKQAGMNGIYVAASPRPVDSASEIHEQMQFAARPYPR